MSNLEPTAKKAEKVQDLAKSAEEPDKSSAPYKAQGHKVNMNLY